MEPFESNCLVTLLLLSPFSLKDCSSTYPPSPHVHNKENICACADLWPRGTPGKLYSSGGNTRSYQELAKMSQGGRNLFSYFKPVQAIEKTPSNKQNQLPLTKQIDTSKQSKSQEQENEEPMETSSTVARKRSKPLIDDDDSEGEIGRFKVHMLNITQVM